MLSHVDDSAVRVSHKESSEPPVLVGKRVDDLGSGLDGPRVNYVDIVHLN